MSLDDTTARLQILQERQALDKEDVYVVGDGFKYPSGPGLQLHVCGQIIQHMERRLAFRIYGELIRAVIYGRAKPFNVRDFVSMKPLASGIAQDKLNEYAGAD